MRGDLAKEQGCFVSIKLLARSFVKGSKKVLDVLKFLNSSSAKQKAIVYKE